MKSRAAMCSGNFDGGKFRRDDSARNAIEPPAMIPDFALFLSQKTVVEESY